MILNNLRSQSVVPLGKSYFSKYNGQIDVFPVRVAVCWSIQFATWHSETASTLGTTEAYKKKEVLKSELRF